jgi:hypothetical protein
MTAMRTMALWAALCAACWALAWVVTEWGLGR